MGQSIADAGAYAHKGKMKVWARSDMDYVSTWDVGKGDEGELQLQEYVEFGTDVFRQRTFVPPATGARTVRTAQEERGEKSGKLNSDYLIDVVPSLGVSRKGTPMIGVGTNESVQFGQETIRGEN